MSKVILVSSDEQCFTVDLDVAKMSTTLHEMLENLGVNSKEGEEERIPVQNVRGEILKLVIEWSKEHQGDADVPVVDAEMKWGKRSDDISEWDQNFLKLEKSVLFDLILAANYLDIKGLWDVTCKTLANMIKGKTPEEIRETFNIRNDFTPEEEEKIRKENEWCQEK